MPIYRQLIEQVLALRSSARLAPGAFLPSVRQISEVLVVNPMTVSKAWSLLERDGVVERVRGRGMRVTAQHVRATPAQRVAALRPLLERTATRSHQLMLPRHAVIDTLDGLLATDEICSSAKPRNVRE